MGVERFRAGEHPETHATLPLFSGTEGASREALRLCPRKRLLLGLSASLLICEELLQINKKNGQRLQTSNSR